MSACTSVACGSPEITARLPKLVPAGQDRDAVDVPSASVSSAVAWPETMKKMPGRVVAGGDDPLARGDAAALEQRPQRAELVGAQVAGEPVLGERDRRGGGERAAVALDQPVLGPRGRLVDVVEDLDPRGAGELAVGVDERQPAAARLQLGAGRGEHRARHARRSPTRG